MSLREDYIYWYFVYYFLSEKKYHIITISQDQNEIWLENMNNRDIPIIRLKRTDLDWTNWMKRDIERTVLNGINIKKALYRRNLDIFNLYISEFSPVDSYQDLLNHIYQNTKEKVRVRSLIVEGNSYPQSLELLEKIIGSPILTDIKQDYVAAEVEDLKLLALNWAVKEEKKDAKILSAAKPVFSYVFLGLQIILYFLMEFFGGSENLLVLVEFGAKFNPLIIEGEWWRLITPIFLHIGFLHLLMNSFSLYIFGTMAEKIFGNFRFFLIYLVAGLAGTAASFAFSPNISAGASGAIFGCFGALLYFGLVNPRLFKKSMGMDIIMLLVINLGIGFFWDSVDNAAHLGGLIGGFLAAGAVHMPKQKTSARQLLFAAGTIILITGAIYIGYHFPKLIY